MSTFMDILDAINETDLQGNSENNASLPDNACLPEMLIEEVRNHPCVWDVSARSYKEKPKKVEAWRRISSVLQTPENTLQKLFEKLRDNYRRCLRKREKLTRSGAENKKLPSCEYFAQLSFLKDIMTGRTTCSNIPPFMSPPSSPCLVSEATPSEETSDLIESNFSNNENHSDETLNMLSPVHTENTQKRLTQKSGKKRKSKDIDELLALSLEEDMNKKKETKEDDADSLFCRSLIPEFKALSKQDKKRAKVKVLQVLMEFDED